MITGCTSVIPPPTATRLRNIIYSDPTYGEKITENTIKDLQYMSNYVYSGTSILSASKKAKIDLEFQRTLPTTFGDLDSICPDDAAGGTTKTLWPSLIGTGIEIHPCQDHHTYFYGDYTHT